MANYRDLKTLFHQSEAEAKSVYEQRIASKDAVKVPFFIKGNQAFYLMDSKIYELIIRAERLNKSIDELQNKLPAIAIKQYLMYSLIDEIVLTNDIEGVYSSRQEIGAVLDGLSKKDKRGRFQGIVEKYNALASGDEISLSTCKDIRMLYDDLVLDEVIKENPESAPDGTLFRKGITHVLNESGIPIHDGVEPENKIIELMEHALAILNDESFEVLVRVSLFHFMFAFIHPFYDGNGRTNRFISSYVLAHAFNPLSGLRLSYAVKKNSGTYYKAFSLCEHPLNKADLTPFIISFAQIVVEAMQSMNDSLQEKANNLAHYFKLADRVLTKRKADKRTKAIAEILIQATLFSELGISVGEIAATVEITQATVYTKLKFLETDDLVVRRKQGRTSFLSLDLEKLEDLYE